MISKIYFTKMHALGNDFVVLEAVTQSLVLDNKLAKSIADRHLGIGCDQILVLEPPRNPREDFFYRIFNANGQEVGQCGNGARCLGRFILERGLSQKKKLLLGTHQGPLSLSLESRDNVTVFLPKPNFEAKLIPIKESALLVDAHLSLYDIPFGDKAKNATVLSLGNPHCVFFLPNIEGVDLNEVAFSIEQAGLFPEGVNIGIAQILAKNHIKLRVFERGAKETLACGSGACAAVIAGIQTKGLSPEVKVDMLGGAATVHWPDRESLISLSGETQCVFDGFFVLQNQPNFSLMLQKNLN